VKLQEMICTPPSGYEFVPTPRFRDGLFGNEFG